MNTEIDSYQPTVHVELPSGALARVSPNVQPETLAALDEMAKTILENEREHPLFLVDSKGETEVHFPLVGGGYLKVTGRSELVYDDNPAASFRDDDK